MHNMDAMSFHDKLHGTSLEKELRQTLQRDIVLTLVVAHSAAHQVCLVEVVCLGVSALFTSKWT